MDLPLLPCELMTIDIVDVMGTSRKDIFENEKDTLSLERYVLEFNNPASS
jgi:hypothetical protein